MRPAGIAPTRQVATASADAVAFVDTLRAHQQQYLESVGAAGSLLCDDTGHLSELAASTTQMTRQFFDAQRALLTRQASYDAQYAEARRSGDVNLDDPELLNLERWDAAKATRQLSALLDGWWAALNAQGQQMMDVTSARRALRRQVGAIDAGQSAPERANGDLLPGRVLAVLDQDRSPDLTALIRSLLDVLAAPSGVVRPMPAPASVSSPARVGTPITHRHAAAFPPPCMPASVATSSVQLLPDAAALSQQSVRSAPVATDPSRHPAAQPVTAQAEPGSPFESGNDLTIRLDEPTSGERWLHRLEQLGHVDSEFWGDHDRGGRNRSQPRGVRPSTIARTSSIRGSRQGS